MDNLSRRAESILSKFNCSQKTDWTRQYFYSDFKMFHPLIQWCCISVCCKGSGTTRNLTFLVIKLYVQYKYFYLITCKVTWPKKNIMLCSVFVAFKSYNLKYCFKTMVKHKSLLFKYIIIKINSCFQDSYWNMYCLHLQDKFVSSASDCSVNCQKLSHTAPSPLGMPYWWVWHLLELSRLFQILTIRLFLMQTYTWISH